MWRPPAAVAARRLGPFSATLVTRELRPSGMHLGAVGARGARGIVGPAGPLPLTTEYPGGSMAQHLLDRCLEGAVSRGIDVTAPYKPWLPVDLMQTMLVNVHDTLGCSWTMAIVLACLGIRIVTLPVSVAAIRGAREKALIQPQFVELTQRQQALAVDGDQQKKADNVKKLQDFTQKHGKFFMLKGTWNLILFQMPLYITAFAAMRGLASHPDLFRGFAMEAPLWLDSLALQDPYAILPVFTAAIMLTNIELFGSIDTEAAATMPSSPIENAVGGTGTFQKYQKHIMRGSAVAFVPLMWSFPAGVFIFMSTNMISSQIQNRVLRLPVMERLLELPPKAEEATAAAAAAMVAPPTLLPLGSTVGNAQLLCASALPPEALHPPRLQLPGPHVAGAADTASSRSSLALPGGSSRATAVLAAAAMAPKSATKPSRSYEPNPRFAVRRADGLGQGVRGS